MTSEVQAAVNLFESGDVGGPAQPLLTVKGLLGQPLDDRTADIHTNGRPFITATA